MPLAVKMSSRVQLCRTGKVVSGLFWRAASTFSSKKLTSSGFPNSVPSATADQINSDWFWYKDRVHRPFVSWCFSRLSSWGFRVASQATFVINLTRFFPASVELNWAGTDDLKCSSQKLRHTYLGLFATIHSIEGQDQALTRLVKRLSWRVFSGYRKLTASLSF